MADKWEYGAIVNSTWHGKELEAGVRLQPGVSTKEGLELSRIGEVFWTKAPVFARLSDGSLYRVDGQYLLERGPRPWVANDQPFVLPRQVSEEFEVVQGADLANLAQNVSDRTEWPFMAAVHLDEAKIVYVQLEINREFVIGGKTHEAHKAKLFFGDDKSGGATFGGITYTRIQCWNTWRAALSGSGVWKLRHDDSPIDRMNFIAEKCVEAYRAMDEEQQWLDAFFRAPMAEHLFGRFVHDIFPDPRVTESMIEAEMARVMVDSGQSELDLTNVIAKGQRSEKAYEQRLDLARRRRLFMENKWEEHNAHFPDSRDKFYAAAQALTATTSHGPFQDKSEKGAMFGVRADFNDKGMLWLKEACKEEGYCPPNLETDNNE